MEIQELVTGIRWELLRSLADQPLTGADLARLTNTTPANVSQHLKLLELAGLVVRERVNGKSMHYRLKQDVALVTLLGAQPARQSVQLNPIDAAEMRLFLMGGKHSRVLRRFMLDYEELASGFLALALVKEEERALQLLVISSDVRALRKEHANINLGDHKIIIWSHTPQEFHDGLQRKEHYFTDMLRHASIIMDPTKLLTTWKEGAQ